MKNFIQVQNAEMVFQTKKGRFHALREIDARVATQRREHVRHVAPLGYRENLAIHVERLDRPTFDAAQVVFMSELGKHAVDGW